MREQIIGEYDYDTLRTCPFCGAFGLTGSEAEVCPHYVAAFQDGSFLVTRPPIFCDGFRFDQDAIVQVISGSDEAVCILKLSTVKHPAVAAYYAADPAFVRELRSLFQRARFACDACADCGSTVAVEHPRDGLLCVICGESVSKVE